MMVGAKNDKDPFHRSMDPSAMNLLHLILLDVGHLSDSLPEGRNGLLLHLPIPGLSVSRTHSISFAVFAMGLQSLGKVVKELHFYLGIHLLGFDDNYILEITV